MKKLDEIMELMSDEMADFEINVHHLQQLNKELESQSIPISTAALEVKLQEFLTRQIEMNLEKDKAVLDIKSEIKKSNIIPKNILTLFATVLLLLLTAGGYFGYQNHFQKSRVIELYEMVLESETENYNRFFSEYPKLKEDYCSWLEQNHK